jgi:hypothetical protein
LRTVFTEKEEASAKRDKRRCREKEEQMKSFADIQNKTLEVYKKENLNLLRRLKGQGPRNLNSKQKRSKPHCSSRRVVP